MSDQKEKLPSSEELCQRIERLLETKHLSDEEKLEFARQALAIIREDVERGVGNG